MAYTIVGLAIALLVVLPAWIIKCLLGEAWRQAKWKSISRQISDNARTDPINWNADKSN